MPEITIIKHTTGERSIQYWVLTPASEWVEQYTVKNISEKQLEAIKNCTPLQIEQILKNYI